MKVLKRIISSMFSNLILFAYVKPCAHLQCYKMMRVKRAVFMRACMSLMCLMLLILLPMKLLWFFCVLKHVCFYLIRVCDVMKYNGPEEEDTMAIRTLNKYKYGSIKYTCVIDMRFSHSRFYWQCSFLRLKYMMKKIATTPEINITSANTFCYIFISTINIKYFHFNSLSGWALACARISVIVCTYIVQGCSCVCFRFMQRYRKHLSVAVPHLCVYRLESRYCHHFPLLLY